MLHFARTEDIINFSGWRMALSLHLKTYIQIFSAMRLPIEFSIGKNLKNNNIAYSAYTINTSRGHHACQPCSHSSNTTAKNFHENLILGDLCWTMLSNYNFVHISVHCTSRCTDYIVFLPATLHHKWSKQIQHCSEHTYRWTSSLTLMLSSERSRLFPFSLCKMICCKMRSNNSQCWGWAP